MNIFYLTLVPLLGVALLIVWKGFGGTGTFIIGGLGGTAITFGETVPALGVDIGVTAKLGTALDITEDEGGNTFTTLLVTAVFVETLSDTIELFLERLSYVKQSN